MQAETDVFKIGCRSLCLLSCGGNGAADTSPKIDLIVQVDRQEKISFTIICEGGVEVGSVGRGAHVRDRRCGSDCGYLTGTIETNLSTRRLEVCGGLLQGLVGWVNLDFKRVQLVVVEELPPCTLELLVAGLRGLPAVYGFVGIGASLLELRGQRYCGPGVLWADPASGDQDAGAGEEGETPKREPVLNERGEEH